MSRPALVIDGDGDERLESIKKNALGNAGMDIEVYKQRLDLNS
jgi:hypothetical protein